MEAFTYSLKPEEISDFQYDKSEIFAKESYLKSVYFAGCVIVFLVGIVSNMFLICSLRRKRIGGGQLGRTYLSTHLAVADLLVSTICVPISLCAVTSSNCWSNSLKPWACHVAVFLQKSPVTATTLSLAILSLDRWIVVCHPKFVQRFWKNGFLISFIIIWVTAIFVSSPSMWALQWKVYLSELWAQVLSVIFINSDFQSLNQNASSNFICEKFWTANPAHFDALIYCGITFVCPASIVVFSHSFVRKKLTSQLQMIAAEIASQTTPLESSRANTKSFKRSVDHLQAPEYQLPLPIRQSTTISVKNFRGSSDMYLNRQTICQTNPLGEKESSDRPVSSSEDNTETRIKIKMDLNSLRELSPRPSLVSHSGLPIPAPAIKQFSSDNNLFSGSANLNVLNANKPLSASKSERSIIRAHRKSHSKHIEFTKTNGVTYGKTAPAAPPNPSPQSLHSRKLAGQLLAICAALFVICWAPYVTCQILEIVNIGKPYIQDWRHFALLLGHAHSAINPIVSLSLHRLARLQKSPIFKCCARRKKCILLQTSKIRRCICCINVFGNRCLWRCQTRKQSAVVTNPSNQQYGSKLIELHHKAGVLNNSPNFLVVPTVFLVPDKICKPVYLAGTTYVKPISNFDPSKSKRCIDMVKFGCCANKAKNNPLYWEHSSTNDAALGAFHPKYNIRARISNLSQISKCHTSQYLR